MTLSMSDNLHNNALPCAECVYGACCILCTIMLSVIMLNVVILSVVMLNVVMLSVVAPNHLLDTHIARRDNCWPNSGER
jgi:hypothetical protein